MKIFIAIAIFAILAAALTVAMKRLQGKARAGAYRARKLMTENELEFFGRLVSALPDHYVFPQVAMSALLEAASSDKKKSHSDRLRIAQQRADYIICTRSCDLVAVIELDDRTHSATKDQLRDSRLEQAGIRTVRFQSRSKPRADAIRLAIVGPTASAPTLDTAPHH
ncbi:DUF2726 domain-containing protein [Massilia sp. GCM10020059]|uniref:DUF2726 domain-containing protein n=1 Tax=Massilia agrisoli TaxID=2892444 RepID=A0ABS8J035_9BURK|nr:DUF2726 domain-containing protein [Massilia agrisoli]MCC6072805.1 DUF2726 domain-containing protein [Massilia agrisoli]